MYPTPVSTYCNVGPLTLSSSPPTVKLSASGTPPGGVIIIVPSEFGTTGSKPLGLIALHQRMPLIS